MTNKRSLRALVIDKGAGIKDEDKSKIFKLFSSLKEEDSGINVGGIGLGLVISKMIVNKFNGNIEFQSTFKKGSTFYFTFEHELYSQDDIDYINVYKNDEFLAQYEK